MEDSGDLLKDIDMKEIHATVIQICKKFKYDIMRCIQCPIVLECSYPKRRLDKLRGEAQTVANDIYEEEIELDQSAENLLRASVKKEDTYNQYLRAHAHTVLKNDRCVYEREDILTALQKFVDAGYNIADPRCFLIINELIGNLLNSGRANKTFSNLGVLLRKETPAGPIYYKNPLLDVKRDFSKLIVESTEALDRILKSDATHQNDKSFTTFLLKQLDGQKTKAIALIEREKHYGRDE